MKHKTAAWWGLVAVLTGLIAWLVARDALNTVGSFDDTPRESFQNQSASLNWIFGVILLGFVGALLTFFYPRIGGILQILAGISGCLILYIFWSIPALLFIIAGVMAFRNPPIASPTRGLK
jgi:hypothetical protein